MGTRDSLVTRQMDPWPLRVKCRRSRVNRQRVPGSSGPWARGAAGKLSSATSSDCAGAGHYGGLYPHLADPLSLLSF